MSLELNRESIRVTQLISQQSTQTIVENDIIVPDIKPDITRVLLLDGDAYIGSREVMQDKLLVNGTICYKILYLSDEENRGIKSINSSVPFSENIDIPDARHGMDCKVKCNIEHIDFEILNGRKIGLKSILNISGTVTDTLEQEIVNDLSGLDNIQTLRSTISLNCYSGANEDSFVVREGLELPAGKPSIKEILRTDVKLSGRDYKIADNKVIAKGDLNVQTIYIGDDEAQSIQVVEHEIPFTQFIDVAGINEAARCSVEYQLAESSLEAAEDNDGELRVINIEAPLKLSVTVFEEKSLSTLEDAYSPRTKLDLEKDSFTMSVLSQEDKVQINVRDTIIVPEGDPEITEVFNVLCKPVLSECKIVDNNIVVEGVVNNSVLYLADNQDQPIYCLSQEVPFRQIIELTDMQDGALSEADLDLEYFNYSVVTSNEVEVRLSLSADVKVSNQLEVQTISRVVESPVDDKKAAAQPSITIYFAQPGDTLWKIAKRYYTTMDDIRKANSLIGSDVIEAGQQIFIPRRVS